LFESLVRAVADKLGLEIRRKPMASRGSWSAPLAIPEKGIDARDRFREILSDPLNLLIERDPMAGVVLEGLVKLHTGIVVPIGGIQSYYRSFSDILALNRGVHEPLEEFAFQEVVKAVGDGPVMLELGAYWGHYSMWLKKFRPNAEVYLVEPELPNLEVGKANFKRNKLDGTFIHEMVGKGHFEVDNFIAERGIRHLDILHADIQGAEVEMLQGCERSLGEGKITYCFISTHSQELHSEVQDRLRMAGFRIEASADFDRETTSYDGLVFAVHERGPAVLNNIRYLGRDQIVTSSPDALLNALNGYAGARTRNPAAS
jgi:hypothetical protein